MKRLALALAAGAIVVGAGLSGCSGDDVETTEATVAAAATTTTATSEPTAAVTTTTTEPMDPDAACVDCHTNKDTLTALAVEPADTESLSSGEG
ncbi:MAG: hypothetical protein OEX97_09675 [Acidimicrobiia bacterium]|nr:hypothetical protein [Acidimicrobiia bacterium]